MFSVSAAHFRTAAMKHRRGELAYKAVLDKRVCPGCGAEQSYDEASSSANPKPTIGSRLLTEEPSGLLCLSSLSNMSFAHRTTSSSVSSYTNGVS